MEALLVYAREFALFDLLAKEISATHLQAFYVWRCYVISFKAMRVPKSDVIVLWLVGTQRITAHVLGYILKPDAANWKYICLTILILQK